MFIFGFFNLKVLQGHANTQFMKSSIIFFEKSGILLGIMGNVVSLSHLKKKRNLSTLISRTGKSYCPNEKKPIGNRRTILGQ